MSYLFNLFFYNPLYNGLVALLAAIPFVDAGVAVILFTIIVKLILFPLSKKSVKTQLVMKDIQPEIDQIKEKCKGNKQEEAVKTMALYKEKGVNPFSGILLVILQIPIIFALYFIFLKGGLPKIDTSLLYSFVPIPATVNMNFLGLLDISKANAIAAILVGLSQFFQIRFTLPKATPKKAEGGSLSFKDELAKSMNLQMKYVLPVFITIAAWALPAVVSFYWITSNLFAIGQEVYMRQHLKKEKENK